MKMSLLLALSLFISFGCSTPSIKEEDCKTPDWHRIGEVDGSKGLSLEMLDNHIKICRPKIESAVRSLYIKGHENGVKKYCIYRTGFLFGEEGETIPKLCEHKKFEDFHKGYKEGLKTRQK